MSESAEPSYYEIALTNRQVVIAFVILLTLVLAIFLCGVWVGKNGQARLASQGGTPLPAEGTLGEQPEQLANMEEFKFFAEEGKNGDTKAPDLSVLAEPETRNQAAPSRAENRRPLAEPREPAPAPAPSAGAQQERSQPQRQAQTQNRPAQPPQTAAPSQTPPPPKAQPKKEPPRPAPAQTRTEAPSRPPQAADEGFVVQVFSTQDEAQARKVMSQLKNGGHKAFLSAVEVTGKTMYRVRVGPFNQRAAADKAAGQVRHQMKLDVWVTAAGN